MGALARRPVITVAGVVLILGLLSLILPSTPTYDPWAWIIWGREVVHGDLNTLEGPSWKPLPVVVTALAAPFGEIAPTIWVLTARVGALTAVVLAFVIARRLGGLAAGLLAGASLMLAPWWIWHGWLANSEGLLMALVLGAIAAELVQRRRIALACAIGAGLLRPEAWPFLLLYAAWLAWRADWRGRAAILAALAILPPAWLLPEKWGSGDYWRAASRAQNPDPGAASLTDHPWWTIIKDFVGMLPTATWAVVVAAVAALLLTLVGRRAADAASPAAPGTAPTAAAPPPSAPATESTAAASTPESTPPAPQSVGAAASVGTSSASPVAPSRPWPAILAIAGFGVAWLLVVIVMTERGFSGNERYLIPPVALIIVAAAAGFGRLLPLIPVPGRAVLLAGVAVAIGVGAVQHVPEQMRRVLYESRMVDDLPKAIEQAGGAARLRACAPPATHKFMVPQAAWYLRVHANQVSMTPEGPYVTVLRTRLVKGGSLTPTVRQIPGLQTLAETPYWQIVARCRPDAKTTR